MADWVTISSLATAGGTLVLAAATFSSVRSANRAARVAERSLLFGQRPLLFPSRLDDPVQKVMWVDEHRAAIPGGRATVELDGQALYLAASLRNVGNGTAVIQAWRPVVDLEPGRRDVPDPDSFRPHSRDLYVPSGDMGFWQAAIRDPADDDIAGLREAIADRRIFAVDLLYSDHEGRQRSIGRFSIAPASTTDDWLFAMVRHWSLDQPDPR
jgi:hypothetical protein